LRLCFAAGICLPGGRGTAVLNHVGNSLQTAGWVQACIGSNDIAYYTNGGDSVELSGTESFGQWASSDHG